MTFLNSNNIYSVYIVSKYIVYSDSFPIKSRPNCNIFCPFGSFHSFKDALIRSNLISICTNSSRFGSIDKLVRMQFLISQELSRNSDDNHSRFRNLNACEERGVRT